MNKIKFNVDKDSFGVNSLRSFVDHVNNYQVVENIINNTNIIDFEFGTTGIPVYDIFEFYNDQVTTFSNVNIIVVETFKQFRSIEKKLEKNKKYIVLSESFWNVKNYNSDIVYELVYVPWDLIDFQNKLNNRSNLYFHLMDVNFLDNYSPQYDFLSLIGRSKLWRDKFVEKLHSKIDLSNTLTSYYGTCLGNKDLLKIDINYDRSLSKIEFENKFYNDVQIPNTNYVYNLSYFTKNELFSKTKFSVVVETEAELEEYHVTEKTLKCLILGHPFVVIGTPYYLEYLHNLGFNTFGEIFDESYDSILNLEQRMDSAISLIEKLRMFTFDINKLKEIQNRNLCAITRLRNTDTYVNFLKLFNDKK